MSLNRTNQKEKFDVILSLENLKGVRQKPAPDGYIKAIKELASTPKETIIVEDSDTGVTSAKASGAFTIAFRAKGNIYSNIHGDAEANSMMDVINIVRQRLAIA